MGLKTVLKTKKTKTKTKTKQKHKNTQVGRVPVSRLQSIASNEFLNLSKELKSTELGS